MNYFEKCAVFWIVCLFGVVIGLGAAWGVMVADMDQVPDGKTWVLYEFSGPYRTTIPEDALPQRVWGAGDRIHIEEHWSDRHNPPFPPPAN